MVSSTPRPHFTPGKDPVPILQEAGLAPRPVWTGGKSRPHRDSIPDRSARSQSTLSSYYIKTLKTAACFDPFGIIFREYFDVLLTVRLSIIFAIDQLYAQILVL